MTLSLLRLPPTRETRDLLSEVSHLCSLLVRLPAPADVREERARAALECARTALALEDAILHGRGEAEIARAAAEALAAAAAGLAMVESGLRAARASLPHPQR